MSQPRIRVLIADDDALVRSALGLMLGGSEVVELVSEATDGAEAVRLCDELRPDVVLMDIRMPRVDGLEATRRISGREDAPRVIVLTTFGLDEYILEALAAGADGFLLKDTPPADILAAIRAVAEGDPMLSPAATRTVLERLRSAGGPAGNEPDPRIAEAERRLARLTEREREVALAIGRGLSNADIGAELYLSVPTVKAHVSRLFDKLEVANRVQIAICVHDAGLV